MGKAQCFGVRHVDLTCSDNDNGCKVLAHGMRDRTCREYCSEHGLPCIGAWEDLRDDCDVKETLTCDQTVPGTHDLICECLPAWDPTPREVAPREEAPREAAPPSEVPRSRLVWSDDFDGDRLDSSKWSIVSGGGGFGNNERQYYSHHAIRVGGGMLRITAQCEEYKNHHFTSAKVQTKHLADWGPGHRVEVRARLPQGKGTWPAIWMLPTDSSYGGWPRSGEIDIVEAVGCTRGKVYGTVHTQAYNHMKNTEKYNTLHTDVGQWHTYAIEWTASDIKWFVDDQVYHSFDHRSGGSEKWPFDRSFFLILNLAVGGSWGGKCVGGSPSCSSHNEFGHRQIMEVDFARVYAL